MSEIVRATRRTSVGVVRRIRLTIDPPTGERALRRRLVAEGASVPPRRPGPVWRDWLNTALRSHADVEAALVEIAACGLSAHGERTKNWDLLVALGVILDRVPRRGAVLEMGAAQYSRLLQWLYLYGYRSLRGIDLVYDRTIRAGPIRYYRMDLVATNFPDQSFDAIAALSVIEHGVDPDAYLREATRLLRPGGVLVTSTDFWCEPVDTRGQVAYGVPIRIFQPSEIEAIARRAATYGLEPLRPLDLRCSDRVVRWTRFGLDYTFVNLVLVLRT